MMNKKLEHIIKGIHCEVYGNREIEVVNLIFDSRKVKTGDLFIAQRGTHVDGHTYIDGAIRDGAKSILCEILPDILITDITYIKVKDSSEALGLAAANFYDNPTQKLKLIGVTGTNGKTSIATLLYRVANHFGHKAGLLSTVCYMVGDKELPATHTTPDSIAIQSLMKQMVDSGCTHAFMEVSSHSIDQKRIAGLDFDGAIFTNLTHDHLDYHKTFESYLKAKKQLFDSLPEKAFALVNVDDKNGKVVVQNTKAIVKTFAVRSVADFKAKIIESHFDGMLVNMDNVEVWIKLIGEFNASNMIAVYSAAILLGFPKNEVLQVISKLGTVEGRFEYVRSNDGVTAIVDYAHTPDALKNVLTTINQIRNEGSHLISIVGAGGDRDRTKRPIMARISVEMSDKVILTSDNPRSEEPQSIIDEMYAGVEITARNKVLTLVDRREAIKAACMMATPGDVILIAGKGHETYQEVKGVKSYFNDKQIVSEIFMISKINPQ
jgi:UDP-N-acetylmuramoyl-L-alanyl-D-glutamate--2,6-diaminopimelate ligase